MARMLLQRHRAPANGPNNEIRKALRAWDKAIDQPIGDALKGLRCEGSENAKYF